MGEIKRPWPPSPHPAFFTHHSEAVPLLQFFFLRALVVVYVTLFCHCFFLIFSLPHFEHWWLYMWHCLPLFFPHLFFYSLGALLVVYVTLFAIVPSSSFLFLTSCIGGRIYDVLCYCSFLILSFPHSVHWWLYMWRFFDIVPSSSFLFLTSCIGGCICDVLCYCSFLIFSFPH